MKRWQNQSAADLLLDLRLWSERPKAHHPAYAPVIHAASGFDMVNLHYQDEAPRPATSGIFIADVLGGTHAFGAIQAALNASEDRSRPVYRRLDAGSDGGHAGL
jgi:crotonobetainyl-CoA:carnitine CoA-transferase CaiB-like acyl-CoA transferase